MGFKRVTEFCNKDNKILAVYRVGSGAILNGEARDIDLMIVTKDECHDKKGIPGYDCFLYSYSEFLNILELNTNSLSNYYLGQCYLRQASLLGIVQPSSLIYGAELLPEEYNIFKYKRQIIKFILDFGEMNFFNKYLCCIRNDEKYCTKWLYYALYAYYIFQNNSLELTQVQRENVVLAHDCKIPLKYRDILKEKMVETLCLVKE